LGGAEEMAVDYVLAFILLALAALFAVWAAKLWHGKWLNSIAGNTFATKEELELPYQKKMAKELSVLLAFCVPVILMLAYNLVFGMDEGFLYIICAVSFVVIVAGSIVVTVRANKAAKIEQAEAGLRPAGWPTKEKDPDFGGGKKPAIAQWIFIGVAVMMPTIITLVAYFMGLVD